jgi:hypothetical protein
MFRFQVLDHSGHSTLEFDAAMADSLQAGEEKFAELTKGLGMTAYERTGPDNEARLVRTFDPSRQETVFRPRIIGG